MSLAVDLRDITKDIISDFLFDEGLASTLTYYSRGDITIDDEEGTIEETRTSISVKAVITGYRKPENRQGPDDPTHKLIVPRKAIAAASITPKAGDYLLSGEVMYTVQEIRRDPALAAYVMLATESAYSLGTSLNFSDSDNSIWMLILQEMAN